MPDYIREAKYLFYSNRLTKRIDLVGFCLHLMKGEKKDRIG